MLCRGLIMRNIKFRVWNSDENKFENLSDIIITIDELGVDIYRNNGSVLYDYELNQYTGLKDKNGKGVYEGDIIKYSHKAVGKINRVVNYKYGMFGIKGIIEGMHIPFANILDNEYEVIGNIYEDSELLKEV